MGTIRLSAKACPSNTCHGVPVLDAVALAESSGPAPRAASMDASSSEASASVTIARRTRRGRIGYLRFMFALPLVSTSYESCIDQLPIILLGIA